MQGCASQPKFQSESMSSRGRKHRPETYMCNDAPANTFHSIPE
jgi:hypothetical protein